MVSFRKIFFLICLIAIGFCAVAQTDTVSQSPESTQITASKPIVKPFRKPIKDTARFKDTLRFVKDSLALKDSLLLAQKRIDSIKMDSIKKSQAVVLNVPTDTSSYGDIFGGMYIPINLPPVALLEKEHNPQGKEELFYVLLGLVALIGFTKVIFPKYFSNMFTLFFQTTYRQKQAIEQLTNNKISSFLLNIAFIVCLGTYATLVLNSKGVIQINFWMLFLYSTAAIAAIYLFKFIFLNFIGWVFNVKDAMESYTFVVFLSNKMVAILLLPFVFLIAFNAGAMVNICLIVSYSILGLTLLYRFFVVISTLRNDLHFNALHFFLYICAVEILPLMLIFKAVFNLLATEI